MAALLFYLFQTKTKFLFQSLYVSSRCLFIPLCVLWWCLYSLEPAVSSECCLLNVFLGQSRVMQYLIMLFMGRMWGIPQYLKVFLCLKWITALKCAHLGTVVFYCICYEFTPSQLQNGKNWLHRTLLSELMAFLARSWFLRISLRPLKPI